MPQLPCPADGNFEVSGLQSPGGPQCDPATVAHSSHLLNNTFYQLPSFSCLTSPISDRCFMRSLPKSATSIKILIVGEPTQDSDI